MRPRSASTWSTESASEIGPSIEMPLSSYSTISLLSLQMAGERDRFLADAFHQVAVGGEHIGVVIDDVARRTRPRACRSASAMPTDVGERPGRAGRWWSRRRA